MKFIICICFFTFILSSCSKRALDPDDQNKPNQLVPTYGSNATFDIATWNIENFPLFKNDPYKTVHYLARSIRDLDLDLIGFQEIEESSYFYSLLDSLPGYSGTIAPLDNFLRLGMIYKSSIISVANIHEIYTDDSDAFPRPPLVSWIEVKKDGTTVFDFTFIILHLKAFGDPDSENRRRDACNKLYQYINSEIFPAGDKDVIVLGDWNDELQDSPAENVFQIFLEDSVNYTFLTKNLSGQASYPSFDSFIDHILISADTRSEYSGGKTQVLNLDFEFSGYTTYISDHRPVLAQFYVF